MKKIIKFGMLAFLVSASLGLAACGNSEKKTTEYKGPSEVTEEEFVFRTINGEFEFDKNGEFAEITGYNSSLPAGFTIPEEIGGKKVISIGESAFQQSNIYEVTIPNSVTFIGNGAFQGCSNLATVSIGTSVTKIGDYAFSSCGLKSITIPDNVEKIGKYALASNTKLESFNLSNKITMLSPYLFANCISLKTLDLADVKTLAEGVFASCYAIKTITLPNTSIIQSKAFYNCTGLTSISLTTIETIYSEAFANCTGLKTVTFGTELKSIKDYAFYGCSSLEAIKFQSVITDLGKYTFTNCNKIESVELYLDGALKKVSKLFTEEFKETDKYSTENGLILALPSSLKSVKVLGTNGSIEAKAFAHLTSVTSIVLVDYAEKPLTSIAKEAFLNCSSLTSISLLSSITTVSSDAFKGCTCTINVPFAEVPAGFAANWAPEACTIKLAK